MKFKESKSIYLQIADRICDEILQGQYTEEERIPSVREYAATVEVNANTGWVSCADGLSWCGHIHFIF